MLCTKQRQLQQSRLPLRRAPSTFAAEEAFAARDAEKVKAASAAVMAKAAEENRLADVASKTAGKLTAVAPAPAAASGDLVGLFDAELSDDSDSD